MSDYSSEPFGKAMRQLMDERGLSYRQLAYLTGLSSGYLNHLTKSKRPVPANGTVERIARALRVEPDHFREWRARYVMETLSASPQLADVVYMSVCKGGKSRT